MIPFLDISSNNQGPGIDWPTLAKWLLGLHPDAGVIIKLAEGTSYVNPFFAQQRDGAEAAGIQNIGYYDFLQPSQGSGADHADFFFATLGKFGGAVKNCFYCGDFESNDGISPTADLDAFAVDFDQRLAWPAGFHSIMYSSGWYLSPHQMTRDPRLAEMGLWYAAPGSGNVPSTPEPWLSAGKGILLWQYSWHGQVPGISGPVDLDWLVGDISTLRPFQMGYQPSPLAGQAVNTIAPDVPVAVNSQSVTDAQALFQAIARDAGALAGQLSGTQRQDALQIQSDAQRGALVSWRV